MTHDGLDSGGRDFGLTPYVSRRHVCRAELISRRASGRRNRSRWSVREERLATRRLNCVSIEPEAGQKEIFSSWALFIVIMLLITALFASYILQTKKIQAVHETVISIFAGTQDLHPVGGRGLNIFQAWWWD